MKYIFLFFIVLFGLNLSAQEKIYLIKIRSSINPGSGKYIIDSIEKSEQDKVKLLIIELDTPGGLVETTRGIVQKMLSSKIPIAVNVTPPGARAGSAGVMITLASHIASMAPSTNIGAAHPVAVSPDSKDALMEKVVNDISAFVEGIAKARGRNVSWAIDSVRNSVSITADQALKNKVIDFISKDSMELVQKADGRTVRYIDGNTEKLDLRGAVIEELRPSLKLRLLSFIADPNLAYLFMMLAALGIYLELSHPGLILPGVVGGLSGILTMMSFQMLPISTAGIILLILGLLLIGAEFFVTAHGILGAGGTVALILGGIFLIDPSKTEVGVSYSTLIMVGLIFGAAVVLIAYYVLSVRKQPVQTGYEGMIGTKAIVVSYSPEKADGRIQTRGELWHFRLKKKGTALSVGDEVVIKDADGMTFIVEKEEV
ncbi:MAG TPA: nodulation protein NfeD [bacterium]|nr:nodulation protein NfeD [bacterium]